MLKNLTRWVLVPLIFLLSAIILSVIFFFNSDINPNILSHNEPDNITQKNNTISGKIKATDNYLGIVTVRFNKKEQLRGDSVFRIKNILEDDWYHTATISAEQYNTLPFYSFGFPLIEKSKNNTYQFEVKLLSENRGLTLSPQKPVLVSHYAYPKEILLKSPSLLIKFVQKKASYYFLSKDSWKVFAVYSLALLLYLIYFYILHKFIPAQTKKLIEKILGGLSRPAIAITLLAMAFDVFIIRKYADSTTSWLTLLWILGVISYRLEARYSFGVALIFLTFCPFLLSANMDWVAEKSAIWAYIMLVVGTIQSIFEISPGLQKITKTNFSKLIIKSIRSIFLFFDQIVLGIFDYFKRITIQTVKFIFKRRPISVKDWGNFILKFIMLLIIFFLSVLVISLAILNIYRIIQIENHKRIRLSMNPVIKTIEPTLVYKATKIIIYGKEFGDKYYKGFRLLIDGEVVRTDYKDNNKIIFSVPLHWKDGVHKIWIEKQIDWDGKKQIEKSEIFEIKILAITGSYTEDDRLYFEQKKHWQKETLELNGYK